MRHVERGGDYLRVADPGWADPLDGRYAQAGGGRWNPPQSFPVVYLNGSVPVARANVYRLLAEMPYGPEDLDPDAAPILVATTVPRKRYVDAVTTRGLASLGLPGTYPLARRDEPVPREICQRIGLAAWSAGEPGIACISAAPTAPSGGEEMAWFQRRGRLRAKSTSRFDDWFW